MCPAVVVTKARSFVPSAVETPVRKTGAPSPEAGSAGSAGSVAWNRNWRFATFPAPIAVSCVLLPLCAASPLNWSQSYGEDGEDGEAASGPAREDAAPLPPARGSPNAARMNRTGAAGKTYRRAREIIARF